MSGQSDHTEPHPGDNPAIRIEGPNDQQERVSPPSHRPSFSIESRHSEWIIKDRGAYRYAKHCQKTREKTAFCPDHKKLPKTLEQLHDCLQQAKSRIFRNNRHEVPKDYYFPNGSLEQILVEESVVPILKSAAEDAGRNLNREISEEDIRTYARKICHTPDHKRPFIGANRSYRKMFVILFLANEALRILDFVDHELSDQDLPLIKDTSNLSVDFELRRALDPQKTLPPECFDPRKRPSYTNFAFSFESHQWRTLAPFFAKAPERRVWLYSLDEQDILPWTEEEQRMGLGGFSVVSRVQIHASHHNFDDPKASNFPSWAL